MQNYLFSSLFSFISYLETAIFSEEWREKSEKIRVQKETTTFCRKLSFLFGGATQTWTGDKGVADPCLTTWLWRRKYLILKSKRRNLTHVSLKFWSGRRDSNSRRSPWQGDALPLSHSRIVWCLRTESNHRHRDFQSLALPTELQRRTCWAHKNPTTTHS